MPPRDPGRVGTDGWNRGLRLSVSAEDEEAEVETGDRELIAA